MSLVLNNHKLGSYRDKQLYRLLESQVSLNTDQIKLLLFKNVCLRICQRRLTKLTKAKKIHRIRSSFDEPYFYYIDKKPAQVEHVLGVSWIYTWVCTSLSKLETLHCFEREIDYKTIRPDAFIAVKNLLTDSYSFFFAEMDIAESGHDFSIKVKRYNDFYNSESYLNQWWVKFTKRFPVIRVVTTGNVKSITKKIEKENVSGLEFQVFSLEQVKGECVFNGRCSKRNIWDR